MKTSILSDEEKREMLEDAASQSRREAFAQARKHVINQPMTGGQYVAFLNSVQHLFPTPRTPKIIQGSMFRL